MFTVFTGILNIFPNYINFQNVKQFSGKINEYLSLYGGSLLPKKKRIFFSCQLKKIESALGPLLSTEMK